VIAGGALISYRFDDVSPAPPPESPELQHHRRDRPSPSSPRFYFLEDQLRIDAYYGNKLMTDNYFGVGYQLATPRPLGETTTPVPQGLLQMNGAAMWRIRESLYFGGSFRPAADGRHAAQCPDAAGPDVIGRDLISEHGLGPILRTIARLSRQNAFRWIYFNAQYLFYRALPG